MRILPRAGKRLRLGHAQATGILALNGRNNELKKRTSVVKLLSPAGDDGEVGILG